MLEKHQVIAIIAAILKVADTEESYYSIESAVDTANTIYVEAEALVGYERGEGKE